VTSNAIEIEHISKKFRLYQEKYTSLKERVLHAGRVPYHDFWALEDVSIDVAHGETLGILGRNGCGKSTLLKCIAGILKPSSGEIRLRGQLAAMLELGAGFQPELSGRDNIYLNASLLGMSRKDTDRSFDDIVAFAELEEFIDNQVRFYSSGMYVRLGFAVAVNVNPDILLVDEVLAVGDERFQQKCMQRIHEFQREGRTIVVVSHAADTMRQLCDRVAVMNAGQVKALAPPGQAIRAFRDILLETDPDAPLPALDDDDVADKSGSHTAGGAVSPSVGLRPRPHSGKVRIVGSRLEPDDPTKHLQAGDSAVVLVDLEATESIPGVALGCSLFASNGSLVFDDEGTSRTLPAGRSTVRLRFSELPFLDGSFSVNLRIQEPGGGVVYARCEPAATLVFESPGTMTGLLVLKLAVEMVDERVPANPALA
jgi:ABC-type polysaccharide/polyol phosphate transport system ATPase subunit